MFMRFATPEVDQESHQPQGLFKTAYALLEAGDLSQGEHEQLRVLLDWFVEHLPIPDHPYATGRAVFWYWSSSQQCIGRMWELANILRSHGYAVELQTCRRLMNVRYRDDYQVAAYPHQRDSPIITKTTGG